MIALAGGVVTEPVRQRMRRCYWLVAASALVEGACFAVLVPLLDALIGDRFPQAWWWAATLGVLLVLAVGSHRAATARQRAVTSEIVASLQHRLAEHVVALPLGWFSPARAAALTRLANEATRMLAATLNGVVAVNIRAAALAGAVWVVLLVVDPVTGAVAAIGLAILVVLYFAAARLLRGATSAGNSTTEQINAELVEFAQLQSVLRAYGQTAQADSEMTGALERVRAASAAYFRGAVTGSVVFQTGTALFLSSVLLTALYRAESGAVSAVVATIAIVLAALLVDSMAALGRTGSVIWAAERTLAEIGDIVATPALPEPEAGSDTSAPADSSIVVDDITFGYDAERTIIDGVGFAVPQGTVCAIVGPSGSGKTTLARLVARFWDVDTGSITLGGKDIRAIGSTELMAAVSMVFQDVYLFDGTIRENVLIARPDATEAQLAAAAARARVDEIVDRLPEGWDTTVGEGGAALSGGERQRISLARALLKDAPVVLLDEATSALDAENEAAIRAATTALTEGRTVLVIAHRLDTVRAADRIVFLEHGRVAETGTHDELLAAGGRYADFWTEQERAQHWKIGAGVTA
ncbi:ABC transporter ATP-binding protein [Nocardia mangyaensis]|uniref:ABC transporter ATP-binding protein n=1 Tax=Nocardia mangyaensis TaxID=2213200 RepID=UPI002676146D|nr:ABC transporter ATP-binding protein [Nocardia mangyaensis]MDO3645508.1 ABC transporter ATP-binding protein [Nocardia mangyaensis]